MKSIKREKHARAFIIGVLVVALSAMLVLLAQCTSDPYLKQVKAADKAFEAGDLDAAREGYEAALELDDLRVEAYIGISNVYLAEFSDDVANLVFETLETAWNKQEANHEAVIVQSLHAAEVLSTVPSSAMELLNRMMELTGGDARYDAMKTDITNMVADELMRDLYEEFNTSNEDEIKETLQSGKYAELITFVEQGYVAVWWEGKADGKKAPADSHKGIGLYYVLSDDYSSVFCYYGDYKGESREGEGTWIGVSGSEYYWMTGAWAADKPNGQNVIREWNENLDESVVTRVLTGTLVDGLWDGDMTWAFENKTASASASYTLHFENGNAEVVRIDEESVASGKAGYALRAVKDGSETELWMYSDPAVVTYGAEGFCMDTMLNKLEQ
jgi:hypothetical protein